MPLSKQEHILLNNAERWFGDSKQLYPGDNMTIHDVRERLRRQSDVKHISIITLNGKLVVKARIENELGEGGKTFTRTCYYDENGTKVNN